MDKTESITPQNSIIIYHTDDGKSSVVLYAHDGQVWMNQKQMAELFATSVPNINIHINNILKENELDSNSVIKDYLTTASDGKRYEVTFYSLDMILAVGFRVRSNVDSLLQFQQKAILQGAGSITTAEMEKQVENIYADFDQRRRAFDALEADREDVIELRAIEEQVKHRLQ